MNAEDECDDDFFHSLLTLYKGEVVIGNSDTSTFLQREEGTSLPGEVCNTAIQSSPSVEQESDAEISNHKTSTPAKRKTDSTPLQLETRVIEVHPDALVWAKCAWYDFECLPLKSFQPPK